MANIFGAELRKRIEEQKQAVLASIEDRKARIRSGEIDYDDSFISISSDYKCISKYEMELDILDGDGLCDVDTVVDENGEEVRVGWFDNKWGKTTCVARGIFASSIKALCKKTGWTEKTIRVPVWVKFYGAGAGMLGVYNGSYSFCRWHTNMVTGEYFGFPE